MRRMLTNKRGNILLMTVVLALPLLLIFAGLATDMAYYGDIDNELQRAMDSAALAGAGKIGFNSGAFTAVRDAARQYASLNTYRGTSNANTIPPLDENLGNDNSEPSCPGSTTGCGKITLGIWHWDEHPPRFEPSLNGNLVNAVRTQFTTAIPTSFLRVINVTTLKSYAQAIAWAPPPAIPPDRCFPIALTPGSDPPPGNGICGKTASFISSSGSSQIGLNSAGWANLTGCGNPNSIPNGIKGEIDSPPACTDLKTGDYIGVNGGMNQAAFTKAVDLFKTEFAKPDTVDVNATDPATGENIDPPIYSGHGMTVFVPMVDCGTQTNSCPAPVSWSPFAGTMLARAWEKVFSCALPSQAFAQSGGGATCDGNLNANLRVMGWTRFVITQMVDRGNCVVANAVDTFNGPPGNLGDWPPGDGTIPCGSRAPRSGDSALRGIYGFFKCDKFETPGGPGPVASLGKPKLVK
jgi:hypothetical protein